MTILKQQIDGLLEGLVASVPNLLAGAVIIAATWGLVWATKRSVSRVLSRTVPESRYLSPTGH